MNTNLNPTVLAALRGEMGDWVYYSALMPLTEVAKRVRFADEIHPKAATLSDLLQRSVNKGRGKEIAEYLIAENQRLFNSLVVAVYGGQPEWFAFDNLRAKGSGINVDDISPTAKASVGFLSLSGDEKLYALDGQHRLAGIRLAVEKNPKLAAEEVSVIFVAHKNTRDGMERTRRLFTTLNKRAKPVSKGEIITLDEDDAMAITARRLVSDSPLFNGDRIAKVATNNIPRGNTACLTTIGNLYDVLKIIFTKVKSEVQSKPKDLTYYRPSDETLDSLHDLAIRVFGAMRKHFKPLDDFFTSKRPETVVAKHRGSFGGNLLFRPVGLNLITTVFAEQSKSYSFEQVAKRMSSLPMDISEPPLRNVVWDTTREAMKKPQDQGLVRRMYLYMLGSDLNVQALAADYSTAIGAPGDIKRFDKEVKPHRV